MPPNKELDSTRSIDEQLMEIDDEIGVPRKDGGKTGEYVDLVINHLRELREEDVKLRAKLHSSTFYKWLKPSEGVKQDETPSEKEFDSVSSDVVESRVDVDARSVWVGNVDYEATAEELDEHFKGCGAIERITIQVDKFTSQPKGFAYIEFADKENVDTALALDGSMFRDRPIKVCSKRTNKPGISTTNRPPLGRGYYQRQSSYYHQGWRPSYPNYYRGYAPRFTGGHGLYRSRRPNHYTPY